jgi:predicted ABC-type ATPase
LWPDSFESATNGVHKRVCEGLDNIEPDLIERRNKSRIKKCSHALSGIV